MKKEVESLTKEQNRGSKFEEYWREYKKPTLIRFEKPKKKSSFAICGSLCSLISHSIAPMYTFMSDLSMEMLGIMPAL